MKVIKKFFVLLFSFLILSFSLNLQLISKEAPNLKNITISPEEREQLKQLGISDEDINQAMKLFENMTPEEEERLNAAVKTLEEEMVKEGINPYNPNPTQLEEFSKSLTEEAPQKTQQELAPKAKEKPKTKTVKPTVTDKEKIAKIKKIIESILQNLGILIQKVSKDPELNYRLNRYIQELKEFNYYLNIIEKKNILKYLVQPEFSSLYINLEKLSSLLSNQVPLVNLEQLQYSGETENPYLDLGVCYNASPQQIEQAYQSLKLKWDTNIIKQEYSNLSPKALKDKLKEAKLVFPRIQEAYERLIDPQERNLVNLELKYQIQREQKAHNISEDALKKIIKGLNESFYANQILSKIEDLLKKYEPEAVEAKKAKELAQKQALEESKKASSIRPPRAQFMPIKKAPNYRPPIYRPRTNYGNYGREYQFPKPYHPTLIGSGSGGSASSGKSGSDGKKEGLGKPKKEGSKKETSSSEKAGAKSGPKIELPKGKEQQEILKEFNTPISNIEKALTNLYNYQKTDNLNNLKKFMEKPATRSANKENINLSIKYLENTLEDMDKDIHFLVSNKNNFKDNNYILGRLAVIKDNYNKVLSDMDKRISSLLTTHLEKYKNQIKEFNLKTDITADRLENLKKKIGKVNSNLNSLTSIIKHDGKKVNAKNIKDLSIALNDLEEISDLVNKVNKEYPFGTLKDYVTKPELVSQGLPDTNGLIAIKSSLKDIKEILEYINKHLKQFKDNQLLNTRWQLIEKQYTKPFLTLQENINQSVGQQLPMSSNIVNKHFKEVPKGQKESEQNFNLKELRDLAKNINNFKEISKVLIPKEKKPKEKKAKNSAVEKPEIKAKG